MLLVYRLVFSRTGSLGNFIYLFNLMLYLSRSRSLGCRLRLCVSESNIETSNESETETMFIRNQNFA